MFPRFLAALTFLALSACTDSPAPTKDPSGGSAEPVGPAWERTTPLTDEELAGEGLVIDREARELRIPGRLSSTGFTGLGLGLGQPGYHFLCYDEGRVSPLALVKTPVSDLAIQSALIALGAEAGENLEQASWDERDDPKSPAATRKVAGSAVEVFLILKDKRVPLDELIESPGGRKLDIRLGGNLKLRPNWKSGCVVCLVSCPGGRLSNAAYSCHEYSTGTGQFSLRDEAEDQLDDVDEVTVVLALKKD